MEPGAAEAQVGPVPGRRRRGPWLNAVLFLVTLATTLLAGAPLSAGLPEDPGLADVARAGLPYAAAILGILLAHEMGHYLAARLWGVDTTLPFFIPGPPAFGVGTFGAVIRIRSTLPSRRAVLDIGAAGPIAGFVVAVPLLAWGMAHSEVRSLGAAVLPNGHAGSPFAILRALLEGQSIAGEGSSLQLMGDSLLTWGVQRLVLGVLPPGHDVFLHPVAFAGWLGLFVTTLNLLPIGQLDGGHVLYAWLGRERARRASRLVSWGLLLCGLFLSWNWLVWWLITRFAVKLDHPPALEEAPLGRKRAAVAVLSLVLFALTFIPIPVSV
jgi:membrane-associated protease RseP (regulator of RpoE activity)